MKIPILFMEHSGSVWNGQLGRSRRQPVAELRHHLISICAGHAQLTERGGRVARRNGPVARSTSPCDNFSRFRNVLPLASLMFALSLVLGSTASLRADVDWRLSIKIVTDARGDIPNGTIPRMNAEVVEANRILGQYRRGIGFDLTEVLVISRLSNWFNADPRDGATRSALQAIIRQDPANHFYRSNAINIYVLGSSSGTCAFPPDDDIILMGRVPYKTLLLHECGHFFNLFHTHEGEANRYTDGSTCNEGCGTCPRLVPGERDGTAETAPDHTCFNSRDDFAQNLFGVPFASLDAARQGPINNSWFNIMSYHGGEATLNTLTPDQLDRMTGESNTRRRNVATGNTWFVANDGHDSNGGHTIDSRLLTVGRALQLSRPRDIVLLRSGAYAAPEIMNKPVSIYASRGAVEIIAP
ncbi:MAG: hypothetical protein L0Y58_18460 [Verrucomicrobia subdivision 3 bacterium]|nr:hypothetical protein [Limisphaerales bacterium]